MKPQFIKVTLISFLLLKCILYSLTAQAQWRSDPLESFNRTMFSINYNYLDPYILRPVAVVWRNYMPVLIRISFSNFFSNIEEPASMVNSILEGKIYNGFIHFNRFFLNTILGMGGFVDVASMANSKLAKQDSHRFGSTLGYYGIPYFPYIVLPGYGSCTPRQEFGNYIDYLYPTLSWLTFWMYIGKWVVEGIETRAQLLDSDSLLKNSSDPYTILRAAYFQRNNFLAINGQLMTSTHPNTSTIQYALKDIDSG
ncbi:phospholipid-binding lipoprotein MlaA [Candidatus Profftia sp. (ex Adelges kitamiensis)]